MPTVMVERAHKIPERDPLQLRVGDHVAVERRESDWPAFVFVVAIDGGSGWVPERHLMITGRDGIVCTPYDTTELATTAGEQLQVIETDTESGWVWCRNTDGRCGWVPISTVTPLAAP